MTTPVINCIAPSFIVRNAAASVAFYRDKLGFEVAFQEPAHDPFFAIVCRDGAMLFVKAYISVPDPDALAAEFAARDVSFSEPLKDTGDGLRGFEVKDADGYVLFFGRPRENPN